MFEILIWLAPVAVITALFAVCVVFFCRASKSYRMGGDDIEALARKKRFWLVMLILSSICFAVAVLGVLWLALIYIAAIFFM